AAAAAMMVAALRRTSRTEAGRSLLAGVGATQVCTPVESLVAMSAHRKPTKKGRKIIVLECTEQRQMVKDGVPGAGGPRGGVSRYYTEKNVRNTPQLLELRKFNKYLGRHTLHKELK
ncbi:unnamed protein product, partial [Polarella glacialis]